MNKGIRLLRVFVYNLKWWFIKKSWIFFRLQHSNLNEATNTTFSFGVTTYKERFETYLKPLVLQLNYLFPETKILIAINGFHNKKEQLIYLENIKAFLLPFKNVAFFYYIEPQGLCKLWNQLIIKSNTQKIFLLNDDISVSAALKNELISSKITNSQFGLINKSYSHFLIDKNTIKKVGWFDERFPAIGYEDHDFEIRMALQNSTPDFFSFDSIKNEVVVPKDWSWGNADEVILKKYSNANEKHYFSKWEFSETEKKGFIFVRIIQRYVKLKDGMETPNFYPEIQL